MVRKEGIAREQIDDAQIVADMVARVRRRLREQPLDILINDCCFKEEKRLRKSKDEGDLAYLQTLRRARECRARTNANGAITTCRTIGLLQDTIEVDLLGLWTPTYRDVIVLDEDGNYSAVYNLTENDLFDPENYEALKELLGSLATD